MLDFNSLRGAPPARCRFCGGCLISTVIASQCAHWRGDGRECLWCNPFSVVQSVSLCPSDTPLRGGHLIRPAVGGPPSPQGEGFGRRAWYSQYRRGGHWPSSFTARTIPSEALRNRTAPAHELTGGKNVVFWCVLFVTSRRSSSVSPTASHLPPGGRVCGQWPLTISGLEHWQLSTTFGCHPV